MLRGLNVMNQDHVFIFFFHLNWAPIHAHQGSAYFRSTFACGDGLTHPWAFDMMETV